MNEKNGVLGRIANGTNGITTTWEKITKRIAEEYLRLNFKNNRNTMKTLVERYAADLIAGRWVTTHAGLAFNDRGELIDGQHRLLSILRAAEIKPDIAVDMLVTRGLSHEAAIAIDRGKLKTLAHTLQMLGYEHSSHRTVAIARRMYLGHLLQSGTKAGYGKEVVTDQLLKSFIDEHLEALLFATEIVSPSDGPASLASCVGRAFYTSDLDDIRRFMRAYRDEIDVAEMQERDKTARLVKKYIDRVETGGSNTICLIYRKVQNGLKAYLNGTVLTKLCESADNLFPIPGEHISSEPPVEVDAIPA